MSYCERLSDRMPDVALLRAAWSAEEAAHLASCADCRAEWDLVLAALGSSLQFGPKTAPLLLLGADVSIDAVGSALATGARGVLVNPATPASLLAAAGITARRDTLHLHSRQPRAGGETRRRLAAFPEHHEWRGGEIASRSSEPRSEWVSI